MPLDNLIRSEIKIKLSHQLEGQFMKLDNSTFAHSYRLSIPANLNIFEDDSQYNINFSQKQSLKRYLITPDQG
jgi:hypothetical protein